VDSPLLARAQTRARVRLTAVRSTRLAEKKSKPATALTPKSPPSPRAKHGNGKTKRDPEAMRQRILEAAAREFSDHGYAGARVDRITKRARTVDRMLYYYFGSKDGLYRAVLEETYQQMVWSQASLNVNDLDPVEGLRHLIRFNWNHYLEHPDMIRLFNTENLLLGRHVKRSTAIKKLSLPVINILRELLSKGAARGVFRSGVSPVRLYITIAALGYFYVSNRYSLSQFLGIDLMSAGNRAAWLEHITEVVLAHVRAPGLGAG
jgi:TetR/AcrR family transcriptional regulator, upper aerobic nicotinate degradation pathway regulator